jgi:hypothetical protein
MLGHVPRWRGLGRPGEDDDRRPRQPAPRPDQSHTGADLEPADQDLAKRLLNRPSDAPWWGLQLDGSTLLPGAGGSPKTYPAIGELRPLLRDPLGEPVAAVWVSPDEQIRWYIVPDDIDWNVILDWLVHQAIPAYVPHAARRHRTSSFLDADLLTPAERDAHQALADMENRHAEERQRLQADLDRARQSADPVRDGLFYGKGNDLVRAVETVLHTAGFDVVDLDNELGRTVSADLLVTLGAHRRLVEVKSEGRNASESLVNDLLKHLRTWPELRPELPVGGGALVINLWGSVTRRGALTCASRVVHGHGSSSDAAVVDRVPAGVFAARLDRGADATRPEQGHRTAGVAPRERRVAPPNLPWARIGRGYPLTAVEPGQGRTEQEWPLKTQVRGRSLLVSGWCTWRALIRTVVTCWNVSRM